MADYYKAKVKWWSRKKGYGFLFVEGCNSDVMVHYTGIAGDGYKNLVDGATVRCRVKETPRGLLAYDVEHMYAP